MYSDAGSRFVVPGNGSGLQCHDIMHGATGKREDNEEARQWITPTHGRAFNPGSINHGLCVTTLMTSRRWPGFQPQQHRKSQQHCATAKGLFKIKRRTAAAPWWSG
jgi:hypothetical protein